MNIKAGALAVASLLFLVGCNLEEVTVQVPPEVDLKAAGIKSVAIIVKDFPNDPAPVGVMLRAETSSQIRQRLPALALVETPREADAVLEMDVANHGVGPARFQTQTSDQEGHTICEAWQEAFLLVDVSVLTKGNSSPQWQSQLERRNKIELSCTPFFGPVGVVSSPAVSDPVLVDGIVKELAMRLSGYTRHELRPKRTSP